MAATNGREEFEMKFWFDEKTEWISLEVKNETNVRKNGKEAKGETAAPKRSTLLATLFATLFATLLTSL